MTYVPIPDGTTPWGAQVNGAFTSQDGRITSLEAQGSSAYGVYIPPSWGSRWRPARNAAANAPARIVAVGDSITMGFFASGNITTSWTGRVRTALQSQYGDGGQGFLSSMNSRISATGSNEIVASWTADGGWATYTGTWTPDTVTVAGLGIYEVDTTVVGSAITFPGRGSTIKIHTLTGTSVRANYTYSIDGGPAVTVNDSGGAGAANIQLTTITGLTPTNHTVTITHAGSAGQKLSVVGVGMENSAGIIIDNAGRSGARSTGFSLNDPAALNAVWNGGAAYPADLVIYSLGVNDAANNSTGDGWAANVGKFLKAVREAGTGSTDVIILMNHIGNFEGTNAKWQDYTQRARGLASSYNAALVDMWTLGRNSYNYWSQLGYWGDSVVPGAAGTDTVHPSNAGHQAIANAIIPVLTS